jgi:hypothetical protein
VPKRPCTQRAEWRLLRGKPAQQLPAHYQLDCDYGTALIAIYQEGEGENPIYLCEGHAAAMARPDDNSGSDAGVGSVETAPVSSSPPENAPRTQSVEVTTPKPSAPAPSETVDTPAAEVAPPKMNSSPSRGSARDLTYGNPAKALVDETIWNIATGDYEVYRTRLQQGQSAMEAAQAAGGQLAVVHRKIDEYTAKIEALLSGSRATIDAHEVIHSLLEDEILKIIGDNAMGETEKDAAVAHLGEFQEWINRELKGEMTPLAAHRIAVAIGDRANWGAACCRISNERRPVYRAIYRSLRDAIRAAIPDVRDLDERLTNLYAAKSDLEAAPNGQISAPADPRRFESREPSVRNRNVSANV